eukprot:925463-Alexandrium_andersonii.AAC.1
MASGHGENEEKGRGPPAWDGRAETLEDYAREAGWYRSGMEKSKRAVVVARLLPLVSGPGRRIVKNLNASDFESEAGLEKFLELLRKSPLTRLALPDAFVKIDAFFGEAMKRRKHESYSSYIVRESEAFEDLNRSLKRLRVERKEEDSRDEKSGETEKEEEQSVKSVGTTAPEQDHHLGMFKNDMIRGYNLLKRAGVSPQ